MHARIWRGPQWNFVPPGTIADHSKVKLSQLYYYFRSPGVCCLGMRVAVQGMDGLGFLELKPLDDTSGPTIRNLGYPEADAAFVLDPAYRIVPRLSGLVDTARHTPSFAAGRLVLAESGCYVMATFGKHLRWANVATGETVAPISIEAAALFNHWSIVRLDADGREHESIFDSAI